MRSPAMRSPAPPIALLAALLAALAACDDPDPPPPIGTSRAPVTVSAVAMARCDTPPELIDGLSRQLVDAINCLRPGTLAEIPLGGDIRLLQPNRPHFVDGRAVDALVDAAADGDRQMVVRWAYRDVALQHLFWLQDQFRGCAVAAPAGLSNHQNGLAVDLNDWQYWEPIMRAFGWANDLPNDRVHFDYQAPDVGLGALSLYAFQVLWNQNNPEAELALTAELDGPTYDALSEAPVEGFDRDLCEGGPPPVGPGPVRGPTVGQQAWRGCDPPPELVEGIAEQIARGMACLEPDALEPLPVCGEPGCAQIAAPPILEWLSTPALDAFAEASRALDRPIAISEALRDVSLRHFYDSTADNIGCRPPAGRSDVISGRAVRLADAGAAGALAAAGFVQSGDRWIYDGPDAADLDQLSTLTFQQLWNLNRPDDPIDDDGLIGPQTRDAIDRAPIAGFDRSLCDPDPEPDMGPGPDPEPDVGPDPEPDAGPGPDPEPDMRPGAEPEPEPDGGFVPEPEPGPEPDAPPDPEPDPDGAVRDPTDVGIPPPPVPGWSSLEPGDAGCAQAPGGGSGGPAALLALFGLIGLVRRRR